MAESCLPQVQACRIRMTLLNLDGSPLVGPSSQYVTDALASVGFAWEVEAGDEITEKNACGGLVVSYKAPDSLKRGNVTITLRTPDPLASHLLSGGDVLALAGPPAAKGYAAPPLGVLAAPPISLEIWSKRINNGKVDTDYPYAWWAYPYLDNVRPGDHAQENASLSPSFIGQAHQNALWAGGPDGDWPGGAADRVYQWVPTASLPALSNCALQAVAA